MSGFSAENKDKINKVLLNLVVHNPIFRGQGDFVRGPEGVCMPVLLKQPFKLKLNA